MDTLHTRNKVLGCFVSARFEVGFGPLIRVSAVVDVEGGEAC